MRHGDHAHPADPWPARLPVWLPAVAIFLAITLPHLNQGDFRTDTAWYSAIGLQAWRAPSWIDWWSPLAQPGEPYFNKPPLALWIHGLFLWILGAELWVARLGSILAGALTILLTVKLAGLRFSRLGAATAGCVLALTYEFFRRTREVSLDMWHTTFLTAALAFAAAAVLRPSPRAIEPGPVPAIRASLILWAIAGAMVGLALLCKPLQALLALPILTGWALLVSTSAARGRVLAGSALAFFAAILIAAPWHLSMYLLHAETFTDRYFRGEIGTRLAGDLAQLDVRRQRPSFYLEQLVRTYWPWLPAVVASIIVLRRERQSAPGPWSIVLLALLWSAVWLLVLTLFPDRRDRYALVLWPALAIAAAGFIETRRFAALRSGRPRDHLADVLRAAPIIALVSGALFAILPVRVQRGVDPQWPALFAFLRTHSPPDSHALHAGGIHGNMSARLYLEFGHWPLIVRDPDSLPTGSHLLYHVRGFQSPGPNEATLFRERDLWLTRLDRAPWQPRPRRQAWQETIPNPVPHSSEEP